MGLFDYMFNGYKDDPRGLFDGMFADRWAPVSDSVQSGVFDPQGMNNTSAYTAQPPAPPFPIQPPGGMPPRAPTQGYYGGSPATNPLLRPMDPQNAPQPSQQPMPPQGDPRPLAKRGPTFPTMEEFAQSNPTMGDRLSSGIGGFFGAGNVGSGLVNLLGGLVTGQRTDPRGQAEKEAARMYQFLQTKEGGGLSSAAARGVIMNPDLAKEYYKGLANSQPVFAPDGSILQPGSFGQPPSVVGSAAKPELKEGYNPVTQRMELRSVTPPSIGNPRMAVTGPGGPGLPGQGTNPQLPGQANPGVSFDTGPSVGERKTQEGLAESNVADFKTIQTQALASSNQKTVFQRMRQLNQMKGLDEGALAPVRQTFRSAMVSLGLGDASKVKPGEEFSQLANNLVLEASGGSLGNQISDGDRSFLAARIPQISNTQAGREEMLETVERLAQRKIDIAKEAQKYRMSHNGTLDGFQTHIADWAEKNPLFKDRPAVTPAQPGAEGPIQIPSSMSPADVRKNYKSGTKIILPDGRMGTVP